MVRGLIIGCVTWAMVTNYVSAEEFPAVTKEHLVSKVPNFFYFDYPAGDEPGKRIWLRIDDKTWVERYPSGKEGKFTCIGRATVDDTEGIVIQKQGEATFQMFIPDKSTERPVISFRHVPQGEGWLPINEMKKVE